MVESILRDDFLSIFFMADYQDDKKLTERLKQFKEGWSSLFTF